MKNVHAVILKCRADGSKLAKEALLRTLKDDSEAREFFRVVYEPRINFFMKKIDPKFASTNAISIPFNADAIKDIVNKLDGRLLSGHDAKMYIANMSKGFKHDFERELLTMLIERDVKAGFSINTINKVWSNLITDVPYMRCCLPKDAKLDQFPWETGVYSQIKADGMFANVTHHSNGDVHIDSRNGSPFPVDAFGDLVAEVQRRIPRGKQLHGELLMMRAGKVLPRQESNGLFNTLLQGGEIPADCKPVYEAWDIIPADQAFAKNKFKTTYASRVGDLRTLLTYTRSEGSSPLSLIETRVVYSLKEAYDHYRDALERGLEGTIVKHPDMIWQDSTSREQVKLKLEFECDLKIVGFNEGRNKYVGMLGSFQCESSDGKLKVNVSGLTDAQRKEFWEDREQLLGKILTAKSNSIMPPTRSEFYSLFLPIFVEIRLDKRTADSVTRIQEQYEAAIASVAA